MTDAARFWGRVRLTNRCWVWRGRTNRQSRYGRIRIDGKVTYAHRWAYEQAFGPIPPGLFVCHHCDNERCVRPSHLFAGTAKDNAQDMWAKGRHGRATARLSLADVPVIVRAHERGWKAQALALRFGVSKRTIYRVIQGVTFRPYQPIRHPGVAAAA